MQAIPPQTSSGTGLVDSHFEFEGFRTVMPAQAGIQGEQAAASGYSAWIPAFAGMTQHSSTPQNHHDRLLGIGSMKRLGYRAEISWTSREVLWRCRYRSISSGSVRNCRRGSPASAS